MSERAKPQSQSQPKSQLQLASMLLQTFHSHPKSKHSHVDFVFRFKYKFKFEVEFYPFIKRGYQKNIKAKANANGNAEIQIQILILCTFNAVVVVVVFCVLSFEAVCRFKHQPMDFIPSKKNTHTTCGIFFTWTKSPQNLYFVYVLYFCVYIANWDDNGKFEMENRESIHKEKHFCLIEISVNLKSYIVFRMA